MLQHFQDFGSLNSPKKFGEQLRKTLLFSDLGSELYPQILLFGKPKKKKNQKTSDSDPKYW